MANKYRKVRNKYSGKEGYISLNYFINRGIEPFEFIEDKWVLFVPKGFQCLK